MPSQDGCFVLDVPAHGVTRRTTRQALAIASGFLRAGDLARAEQAFLQIARQDPLSGETRFFLGLVHQQRKDLETAIHHYEHALRLAPDLAEARNNLGVILQSRGRLDEAEACFREALKLGPDYAEAHNNLGNALQDQGRFEEAITAYRQALHFRPGYVEALKHLGNALRALGRLTEAIACYDEGLRHAPDHALLHMSRAMIWLQSGDFARGWPECEWRLRGQDMLIHRLPQPVWDGAELGGRTILIVAEQGLGDTIQFIRYASLVARRGGRVVVSCARMLSQILATCPGVDQVIIKGVPLPEFACHAPVMSLPAILGTTLQTIPVEVPYLAADPSLVARWRDALDGIDEFKIGVVWQGNPVHTKDRERLLPPRPARARRPGSRRATLQPAKELRPGSDRGGIGPIPRDRPGPPAGRLRRYCRGDAKPRPDHLGRQLPGPPCRRPGSARLDAIALHQRLAVDDRPRRHPLVSHHASLPPAAVRRLGRALRPARP